MSLSSQPHINDTRSLSRGYKAVNGSDTFYNFIRRDKGSWSSGKVSAQELCQRREPAPEVLIVFLPEVTDILKHGEHNKISAQFEVPDIFWSPVARDASGYFDCQDIRGDNNVVEKFSSHFRFLIKDPLRNTNFSNAFNINSYTWHKLGFYTAWTLPQNSIILCFGLPPSLELSISDFIGLQFNNPFTFHILLVEKLLAFYNTALWSWRDRVRELEQNRTKGDGHEPEFVKMHEIARHLIHSSETLAMAIETMASLIREHEFFFQENLPSTKELTGQSNQTRRSLRSQATLFKSLHLMSKALEERLRNEINLAFNIVAQNNSRVSVQISKAAQIDSAAMKTISILGLVFLPGTFICALFSTSFFNFTPSARIQSEPWVVSEKFWIYWAVTIPLTVVTTACWVFWQRIYIHV